MKDLQTPFRYDFVGSFLRPEKLKEAKKNFEEGKITQDELDKITDECVSEVVAKQKAAGFHAESLKSGVVQAVSEDSPDAGSVLLSRYFHVVFSLTTVTFSSVFCSFA